MSPQFVMRQSAAMLIMDLEDQFAVNRGLAGKHPRLQGAVRFLLISQTDPVTKVAARLPAPLEMKVVANASGFYVFFGSVVTPDGIVRRIDPQGWPWTIRVVSDYYQTLELTPAATPVPFSMATSGLSGMNPIPFPLSPKASYPFPTDPPSQPGGRLRGTFRNPDGSGMRGVRVEALDSNHKPVPGPAVTDDDGQWVLVLAVLPATGKLSVRMTFADGTSRDVANIPVQAGRENNLAQTALRGQVRAGKVGIAGAAIRVSSANGSQTLSDSAGNWCFYFDPGQGAAKVTVTAELPDKSANRSSSAEVQPWTTVVVPNFDF